MVPNCFYCYLYDDFIQNPEVVGVDPYFGVPDVGARKSLIGAARIDDDAGARLVDIGKRLVFALVRAARDRRLAFLHDGG